MALKGKLYARKVTFLIIGILETALIIFGIVVQHRFDHANSQNLDQWIGYGETIMKFVWIPIIFFIASFFVSLFIREKLWVKILIIVLSIIGFVIFNRMYLYPW